MDLQTKQAALLRKTIENVHKFRQPLTTFRAALFDPVWNAALDVIPEDRQTNAIERGFRGGELLEDVDAESGLLHHPADATNLSFDPIEPGHERLLLRLVQHVQSFLLWGEPAFTIA